MVHWHQHLFIVIKKRHFVQAAMIGWEILGPDIHVNIYVMSLC